MGMPDGRDARRMSRRTALILIGAAVVLHALPAGRRLVAGPREAPAFAVRLRPAGKEPPGEGAYKSEEFVSPVAPKVHVGSICELPDGTLASAWYAGSREGAGDVCIYFATRAAKRGSAWSEHRRIVSRWSAARELRRYVRKVGNSVLFTDPDGLLWLVYVTGSIGGWYSSSLNVKTSSDGGLTWSRSRRLTLNPFSNMSALVKNKPLALEGGGFVLPVYHELMGLFPEMVWIRGRPGGRMSWRKSRMAGWRPFFQPAVVVLGRRSAVAFYRCSTPERAVGIAMTSDGGLTWTGAEFTGLPNPNSGLDALLLSDGRILLAFNDHKSKRENLRLAVCDYDGRTGSLTATRVATLEEKVGKRFAYPYIIRTRDGLIHIVYRWHGERGKRIKHVEFNEAWIRERLAEKHSGEARR